MKLPNRPTPMAFAMVAEAGADDAEFITAPEFGCVQHETEITR